MKIRNKSIIQTSLNIGQSDAIRVEIFKITGLFFFFFRITGLSLFVKKFKCIFLPTLKRNFHIKRKLTSKHFYRGNVFQGHLFQCSHCFYSRYASLTSSFFICYTETTEGLKTMELRKDLVTCLRMLSLIGKCIFLVR